MADLPSSLEDATIPTLPSSFYYIPNFISADEENNILSKVNAQPWVPLHHRRLQVYPTTLTRTNVLLLSKQKQLPLWLINPIVSPRFERLGIFANTKHGAPNHVLINEYRPGEGIMRHEDGDAYASVVATVSLGGGTVLDLYEKPTEQLSPPILSDLAAGGSDSTESAYPASLSDEASYQPKVRWRIYQEPRSLLVTHGDAYRCLLHGISETLSDDNLRPPDENEIRSSYQNPVNSSSGHIQVDRGVGIANWDLLGDKPLFEGTSRIERSTRVSLTYRDVLKVSKNIFG